MTEQQILEELRRLRNRNYAPTSGELSDVDTEVAEIDNSIEETNERIAELEAKIADPNNYQYNDENEERDFTIELLQESFINQLEVMNREDAEYRNLQELATNILSDYDSEIESLNADIVAIERRIRKNDVAVRKNIGIRLTDEELADLNAELNSKRERLASCQEMKDKYIADLQNYDELVNANNQKRDVVIGKQTSLNRIIERRKNNPITIDNHKLRLDKDELYRLKASVTALETRKQYITYNPNEEIDKLIAAISAGKGMNEPELDEKKDNDNLVYGQVDIDVPSKEEEKEDNTIVTPIITEPQVEIEKDETEEKKQAIGRFVNALAAGKAVKEASAEANNADTEPVSEEQKEENEITSLVVLPSNLDNEREAVIEDAKEDLKEKKKDKAFIARWKKFSKRAKVVALALVTAGMTMAAACVACMPI